MVVFELIKKFLLFQGMMLLMMGSADALPEAPVAKTVFVEDMSDAQVAKAVCSSVIMII